MGYNIAIDGPAGAGKSTVAKMVAERKGYIYVDTGALYRAMAVYFLQNEISENNKEMIAEHCKKIDIELIYENNYQQVILNGENITDKLRRESVGEAASIFSSIECVRENLLEIQRKLAAQNDVVMDGRDIGTNILPQADLKIYLTASVETRAKRRFMELQNKGFRCNIEEVAHDIEQRDQRDMQREIAPLKKAEDAILLDTSNMNIDEVVESIVGACRQWK